LEECRRRTYAADRQAPLDGPTRAYLAAYLADLRERTGPHLDPASAGQAERLLDPSSKTYLLDWPDLALSVIDHVACGVKPVSLR
jgi:hypothetical protein